MSGDTIAIGEVVLSGILSKNTEIKIAAFKSSVQI